jgi:hypothetical protein
VLEEDFFETPQKNMPIVIFHEKPRNTLQLFCSQLSNLSPNSTIQLNVKNQILFKFAKESIQGN